MAQSKGNDGGNVRTRVSKTASSGRPKKSSVVVKGETDLKKSSKLTDKEIAARRISKYATTTFGFNTKTAFMGSDIMGSQAGNFYSPQLSTDFLEKPQNLRERRAWYRYFYNSNEFVGRAIDLHTDLPLSKIRLEKPHGKNADQVEYIYDFFVEMCDEINLFQCLTEITHEYNLMGNTLIFAEDHDPYEVADENDEAEADRVNELKKYGKYEAERLYKEFKIIDKDPNYKGWRKLIVLPPDQVRIKKIPLSDESLVEFIPDPDTKKNLIASGSADDFPMGAEPQSKTQYKVPKGLLENLQQGGSIPLDTDPYTGSHVHHLARKKSQYETYGVSMLERCINTLLLQDKLRQAQTQIATRHMTPIRIVWAEELSEMDVDNLREQVDLSLVDPDYSIITNYQVNWDEMGSNGRLLELSSEYEHIENSLFAGLGVTRELLTGEGSYVGNRLTLEIMNTQYLLYREHLQSYVENNLFKPVSKKKGFTEKDKFGREKLIYPKLSFTRLAIKDNDAFFDQAMQLYNKGSISIDVILEMLNIDPVSTRKKIEADLFTVNDFAFNQLMSNMYVAAAQAMVDKFDAGNKIAEYLKLNELPQPDGGEEGAGGGDMGAGGMMGRFASDSSVRKAPSGEKAVNKAMQASLQKLMSLAMQNPDKLELLMKYMGSQDK